MDEREYEWEDGTMSMKMGTPTGRRRTDAQVDALVATYRAEDARASLVYADSEWEIVARLRDGELTIFDAAIYRDSDQLEDRVGGFLTPIQVIVAALNHIERLVEPEIYAKAGAPTSGE